MVSAVVFEVNGTNVVDDTKSVVSAIIAFSGVVSAVVEANDDTKSVVSAIFHTI